MKKKQEQSEKKLSLRKVKIMTIGNMKTVRGGNAGADGNDDPLPSPLRITY
ncbi:hypothetical protein J8N07_22140 [Chryseobacterium arthrosphaerae]|uniref:hypothetical protein n=1 Tax=Weeksellaceae TaxID=2762318 RepID=UPI0015C4E1B0|nr:MULTISPECIES: hypothetical protein [Weeksellaceae]MCT3745946.1 hypothetical protein [Elizabethkingia anophelis]MDC8024575.1 hypothetical protein [Elizabethkingia anophelis]UEQ76281.1 hypothetical protein J8N07_22140 [Chryseobacterium arthrosphaerae]